MNNEKQANHIQIKLRRVKKNGMCLGGSCPNKENETERFLIAIESETLSMNKLLDLECLCESCAAVFLDSLKNQCNSIAKQILQDKNYEVDNEADVYEQTVLDRESVIQGAVRKALESDVTSILESGLSFLSGETEGTQIICADVSSGENAPD